MLDHLAALSAVGLTDLFRSLLSQRASEMGVAEAPPAATRRRPGRPPGRKHGAATPAIPAPEPARAEADAAAPERFDQLAARFRSHSSGRAEGTRRDIDETIRFLTEKGEEGAIIPASTPLSGIDMSTLARARDRIRRADVRFPRKNLYLTYLRMLFQWAARQPEIDLDLPPEDLLRPLTAREVADAWPAPVGKDVL